MQNIITLGEAGYECIAKTDVAQTWKREGHGWKKFIHFHQQDGEWYTFGTYSEYMEEEGGYFSRTLRMSVKEAIAVANTIQLLSLPNIPPVTYSLSVLD